KMGPVSWQELRRLVEVGQLDPTDMVLPEGGKRWLPAESIDGLFPKKSRIGRAPLVWGVSSFALFLVVLLGIWLVRAGADKPIEPVKTPEARAEPQPSLPEFVQAPEVV